MVMDAFTLRKAGPGAAAIPAAAADREILLRRGAAVTTGRRPLAR